MQAFKFPDSMNVHFQCVIQVCRNSCPEPKCNGGAGGADLGYAASNPSAVIEPRVPGSAAGVQPINSGARGPQQPVYQKSNRDGLAAESESRLFLGRPRMVSDNSTTDDQTDTNSTTTASRTRREVRVYRRDAQEMTDVSTTRIIQVVAPGDVAFTLNPNQNETVVVQNLSDQDGNHICMSVPSFVGGLTMLLLVLIIACMVSVFLLLRVRQFDSTKKGSTSNSMASLAAHGGFDNPEFVKVSK